MQGDIEISPFFSCDSEMSKLWNSETYWNSISIQVYEREYRNTGKTCRASTKTIWPSRVQKPCNIYSRGNMTEHLPSTYLIKKEIRCWKIILHWISYLLCSWEWQRILKRSNPFTKVWFRNYNQFGKQRRKSFSS